jgi:DNA-binding MarR family transcriptional regulator
MHEFERQAAPLPQRVATGLAKIGLALKHRAWQEAGPRGLNPTQGQILALLATAPASGLSLTALAEQLAVRLPTASDAVRSLEQKGLVQKDRDPTDGRVIRITLTPAGKAEAERVAGWPDFLAAAIASLTVAEQTAFLRALIKMIRTLQERGEIPISRMCVDCRYFRPTVHAGSERPHHCAFVDAPLGDSGLRLDCADHQPAPPAQARLAWLAFIDGAS